MPIQYSLKLVQNTIILFYLGNPNNNILKATKL